MKAFVLEKKGVIATRDIDIDETLGPNDVRIAPKCVGICGSDIHYYTHGHIGDFVVNEPMVLGHEASGMIVEVGEDVKNLKVGDRVCMEPGIPKSGSRAVFEGHYNLDPDVRFWATPPIHGCMRETVIHPASLTFALPDNVSYEEGVLVEPLAIGIYSAQKACIKPGDVAVVLGGGTIGLVTALSALGAGCSQVVICDYKQGKIDFINKHYSDLQIRTVNPANEDPLAVVNEITGNWGADVLFEASGAPAAILGAMDYICPAGTLVFVGMPPDPAPVDIVKAQVKEITMKTIFRYANVYDRAIRSIASGGVNVKPLVTAKYKFEQAVEAYDFAATLPDDQVKIIIEM